MGQQEQLLALATAILQEKQQPQTIEALTQEVSKRFGRPFPAAQVGRLLQSKPQIFIVDGGGRWQLRQQQNALIIEEATPAPSPAASPYTLRRGCYIVFDLEATRQDALSPYTEIIQIAAERWLDGVCQEKWDSYVRPIKEVQERIHQLTHISKEELLNAPPIEDVLPAFLTFVGALPLIAHNGASYDGPLLRATCQRLHLALPESFLVLDTLPLARALLPTLVAHRVGTLFEHFGGEVKNAHKADADVAMLSTIVQHLQRLLHEEASGQAVYALLRRANDPWIDLLASPDEPVLGGLVDKSGGRPFPFATFGAKMTPLLADPVAASGGRIDGAAVEEILALAEAAGRSKREAQVTMSHDAPRSCAPAGMRLSRREPEPGKARATSSQPHSMPVPVGVPSLSPPILVSCKSNWSHVNSPSSSNWCRRLAMHSCRDALTISR